MPKKMIINKNLKKFSKLSWYHIKGEAHDPGDQEIGNTSFKILFEHWVSSIFCGFCFFFLSVTDLGKWNPMRQSISDDDSTKEPFCGSILRIASTLNSKSKYLGLGSNFL